MTDVALRDYLEHRIEELDRRMSQRFELNELALSKAEKSMNERLAGMNEFRDALRDQSALMASRLELDHLSETVNAMRREKANLDGRVAAWSFVVSLIVGGLMMAVSRIWH